MVDNSQVESSIAEIRKRNGEVTSFNQEKITNEISEFLLKK